jgi:predicted AAA+ superfamily ATPase
MSELELSEGLIITKQEEEVIETDSGTIRVKPAWRFLLEN